MTTAASFKDDILPLFTSIDIDHMRTIGVLPDDYEYMSTPSDAKKVLDRLSAGQMPPPWGGGSGPWRAEQIALFRDWIDGGLQP